MNPLTYYPDRKFLTKSYVVAFLLIVVFAAPIVLPVWLIARDEGGLEVARQVLWIISAVQLVWIVPVLLLIEPYYRSLRYEVHDDEVLMYVGVITKSVKHVPFRTVTNLTVKRGPFDRLFGLGTFNIQTAGMSGQQGAEESLVGLANVNEVYDKVATMLRRFRGSMAPTQAEDELPEGSSTELGALLNETRAIRKLLEQANAG